MLNLREAIWSLEFTYTACLRFLSKLTLKMSRYINGIEFRDYNRTRFCKYDEDIIEPSSLPSTNKNAIM
jgi:hypothetical protein